MKRLFFHSYVKYLVLVLAVILMAFLYFMNDCHWKIHEIDLNSGIKYINAFFIGGFVLVSLGALSAINYYGGFDFWQFAFSKKQIDGKRVTAYDYFEHKKAKRNKLKLPYGPYLLVGLNAILISLILYFVLL